MRKKFGVLFQDGALFGSMNLYDNVAFPLRQHTDKGEEEIARDRQPPPATRSASATPARRCRTSSPAGCASAPASRVRSCSTPSIVLFDEPDSGLDPVRTALLCELIKEVHQENGGSYVVITHDIMSARRVAEFIAVLWRGRIVESGPAPELFNSSQPVRAAVPHGGVRRPARDGVTRSMTIARGAVLGALLAVVAVLAIIAALERRRRAVQADLPERGPAREGRRRADRRAPRRRRRRHPADRRQPGRGRRAGRGALRAAARGHDGDDPSDLAVGRREPLHRARARPEQRAGDRGRRRSSASSRRPRSSTSTSSSTRSTRERARACSSSSRAPPTQYEGQGENVNLSARYFNPFLSTTDQLVKELARDQDDARAGDRRGRERHRARSRSARRS